MALELQIIGVVVVVCLLTWLAVGRLIDYLVHHDIVDRPNSRTLHQGAVPRGGGLVIAAALCLALLILGWSHDRLMFLGALATLCAAWSALGWWDDQHDLSPRLRFFIQFLLACLCVAAFGWVTDLQGIYLGYLGAIATVVGILWMANLYNFMDGMDGMAASQAVIAGITLAFLFLMAGDVALSIVCLVVASSSYGFLLWNWRPARIFMGDVGSITLGAFFALMMIIAANRHGYPIVSLVLIFSVFISDSTITLLRRLLAGERIWEAHRSHYYQRLATIGISHNKIVCGAIVMMLLCSLISTLSVLYRDMIPAAVIGIVFMVVIAIWLVILLEKRGLHK